MHAAVPPWLTIALAGLNAVETVTLALIAARWTNGRRHGPVDGTDAPAGDAGDAAKTGEP